MKGPEMRKMGFHLSLGKGSPMIPEALAFDPSTAGGGGSFNSYEVHTHTFETHGSILQSPYQ